MKNIIKVGFMLILALFIVEMINNLPPHLAQYSNIFLLLLAIFMAVVIIVALKSK